MVGIKSEVQRIAHHIDIAIDNRFMPIFLVQMRVERYRLGLILPMALDVGIAHHGIVVAQSHHMQVGGG